MFRWFEYSQVYHPSRTMEVDGAELGRPWEDVFFTASDRTQLNGWFFPTSPSSTPRPYVVLVCHGNGGNISHRLMTCRALLELGVAVFVFDYRGYGRSSGKPTEEGTYCDAEAAYDWLRQKGYAANQILALGESLGGAIAAELTTRRHVRGLVLMSTFTSIPEVGCERFPWLPVKWLCTIRYDTMSKLPRLQVPVLIMHSQADTIIRYAHGQRLFQSAPEPKMLWELYGNHNETLFAGTGQFQEGIRRFLASLAP